MKSILEGLYIGKDGKRRPENKIIGSIFYLILLITLGFSIYGLYATGKANLNFKLYTYSFPSQANRKSIPDGLVVSLDYEGKIRRGAGYTLYRNVSDTMGNLRINLKAQMSENTLVTVSDGRVQFQYIDADRKVTASKQVDLENVGGSVFVPSYFIKLTEYIFVIVGNAHFIPLKVTTTVAGTTVDFTHQLGKAVRIHESTDQFPQVDNLNNNTLAYIYESHTGPFKLMGAIARLNLDTLDIGEIKHQEVEAAGIYGYHRVVGFTSKLFMVACNGVLRTATSTANADTNAIRVRLVTLGDEDRFTLGEWVIRDYTENLNYFGSDNLNSNSAIITYYSETSGGGVYSMVVQVRTDSATSALVPVFGTSVTIESGGATLDNPQHIAMRVLNQIQFGVIFPDMSTGGSMVYTMVELSPNGDLNKVAQSMVVTRIGSSLDGEVHFDICSWSGRRVVLVDSFTASSISHYIVNLGENLATPLGLSWSLAKASYEVQTSGIYKFSNKKLVPGKTYYSDSLGDIFEGDYYGYDNSEFGVFYIRNGQRTMSVMNQIGVAVSDKEMLIRTR